MFRKAEYVFKNGEEIVKNGKVLNFKRTKTQCINVSYEKSILKEVDKWIKDNIH